MPVISFAAGFNCEKASSPVEKMICSDNELSGLDSDMAVTYKDAAKKAADSLPLNIDQKLWLKNTRNACKDAACLKKAYQKRISTLKKWNDPAASDDMDIFGNFTITRDNYLHNPDTNKDEPVKTTDCLTIKKSKGDKIHFSFILIGANGHTCGMDGEAVLKDGAYAAVADKTDPDYPKDCKLKIRIKRNTILLEDADDGCKSYFCGMRAFINGVEFLRSQKTGRECEQF